ncbi:sorbitol dehydrogenase [Parasteatoda tepidariorum]|uniref:sorbitol dehydrogenase n=1 Tax=Parasteatoda tepidariorum TaxID=114398 RepID=UPI0039BD8A2A
MEGDNLSVVLKKIGDLRLENREIPVPRPNEVLLKVHYVGICGSDIHLWKKGGFGDFLVKENIVLGHETSGVVIKTGDKVKHLKPGDKVCVEPGVPCSKCEFCKKGRYNLCPTTRYDDPTAEFGSLCRYYCQDADYCFKLPDNVSLEEGALIEPLSVAVYACRRAEVSAGKTILICGAGPIGLMNLLTCKAMGASKICMTDISDERLVTAKKLGAICGMNVKNIDSEQTMECIHKCLGGPPDITMECSGAESSINFGLKVTKPGGVLLMVGVGPPRISLNLVDSSFREVDIRGVYRYVNCFPVALELVSSGAIDLKTLITHRYKLEDALKAFETFLTAKDGAIKVLIKCSK